MDAPNGGGFWSALNHFEWSQAREYALAVIASGRPDWLRHRVVEGAIIAGLSAALTTGLNYLVVVVRIEERQAAQHREYELLKQDVEERTRARKAEDARIETRVQHTEDRMVVLQGTIADQLAALGKSIAQIDGRTDRNWQRGERR